MRFAALDLSDPYKLIGMHNFGRESAHESFIRPVGTSRTVEKELIR